MLVIMIPNNIDAQKLIDSILKTQEGLYTEPIGDIKPLSENYINEFSRNENSVKVVFDHANFKILQISDNVELLIGYPAEDFLRLNILFAFKLFPLNISISPMFGINGLFLFITNWVF